MNFRVSQNLLSMVPYKPGKSAKDFAKDQGIEVKTFLKLASNESPFAPDEELKKVLKDHLEKLNDYPDPFCRELKEKASIYYDVPVENVLPGNGSNELIDLLIRVFCERDESILTSQGAFIAYKVCAQASGVQVHEVPLKEDFNIDLVAFDKKLQTLASENQLPKIVFIPNPNNPTGAYINKEEVSGFLSEWGGNQEIILVFDEAYTEFVEALDFPDTLAHLKTYKNVVVLRTLSKAFGLAGLRLGFLLGDPEILDFVNRIRNPFNVNTLAQAAGVFVLSKKEGVSEGVRTICEQRKKVSAFFTEAGVPFVPSQTNFVFFKVLGYESALGLYEACIKQGMILRPLTPYGFQDYLRITLGTEEQMNRAQKILQEVLR